ncbi:MAG: thiamine phosphate synthase [Sandaracinus sp.]
MIGVYAIVDPEACVEASGARRDPRAVARAILRGGASRLQLRGKSLPDRALLELARELAGLAGEAGVPFVVNDRLDLALLVGASEVHLGQDDLPLIEARKLAGQLRLGRSTHDLAQVRAARDEGADRIAFGPVFPTRSKANPDPVVGLDRLAEAVALAERPVVAIGGINLARAPELARLGLSEVAVISALCAAPDPEAATARLREALA